MSGHVDHARARELLPWFVNGTLAGAERASVEAHVRDCLMCRIELKEQRALREAVQTQPTVHTSAARGFDRLLERLDGPSAAARDLRAMQWAVGGGTLAIVIVALAVAWLTTRPASVPAPTYSTLAEPDPRGAGAELDLVFADSLAVAERAALIESFGATIVSGPSEIGRYRVRLRAAPSEAELKALLEKLANDARIRFAGRVLREGGP